MMSDLAIMQTVTMVVLKLSAELVLTMSVSMPFGISLTCSYI